jgi:2',3'-cyclic-nucleotide 2'-phosphodiesterase (5'-nucleotidase family)
VGRRAVQGGKVRYVEGRLLPVSASVPADPATEAFLAGFLREEKERLGAPVGRLPQALSGDRLLLRTGEAPLGNLLTDAMRLASGADCAFLNGGAIRAGLPAGEVTGRDLYACLPFFDSLTTVELSGADLKALLDRCAAMPRQDPPGGFLQVSGLTVRYEEGKAREVKVGGAPLEPGRTYVVACTQFLLSGGDGLSEFKNGRNARDWGIGLQELLRRTLARPDFVPPADEERIVRR